MSPHLRAFATVVLVVTAVAIGARVLGPALFDGPPAPPRAWVAWVCAAIPAATAVGCGAAVQWLGLGPRWADRWVVVASGWVCGLVACVVLLTPVADAASLFPLATIGNSWRETGNSLLDPIHGVRVEPNGSITMGTPELTGETGPKPGALQALVGVASLTLWVPLMTTMPGARAPKVAGVVTAVVTLVLLAHAVAAERMGAGWLAASALPLVVASLIVATWNRRTTIQCRSPCEGQRHV